MPQVLTYHNRLLEETKYIINDDLHFNNGFCIADCQEEEKLA